jgi:hypothetical protein
MVGGTFVHSPPFGAFYGQSAYDTADGLNRPKCQPIDPETVAGSALLKRSGEETAAWGSYPLPPSVPGTLRMRNLGPAGSEYPARFSGLSVNTSCRSQRAKSTLSSSSITGREGSRSLP